MRYEIFYLVGSSQEANLERIKKEVEDLIVSSGGIFEKKETKEKRKLSYAIKHETNGTYFAQRFELEKRAELEKINLKMNLKSDVLRFIISKASDLPELKSKEERIQEAIQKEEKQKKIISSRENALKKDSLVKTKEKKSEATSEIVSEKKPSIGVDIDEKLEEILNI